MQAFELEMPADAGPVLDTRIPLDEYEQRVFDLLPEIQGIKEVNDKLIAMSVDLMNTGDEEGIPDVKEYEVREALEESSDTSLMARRIARTLAFVAESSESYAQTIYEAWEEARASMLRVLPGEDPEQPEASRAIQQHMLETSPLLFQETELIAGLHRRYAGFNLEQKGELLHLLLRAMPLADTSNRTIYSTMASALSAQTSEADATTPMEDMINLLRNRELDKALWLFAAGNPDVAQRTQAIQRLTSYVMDIVGDVAPDVTETEVFEAMGDRVDTMLNGEMTELHWLRTDRVRFLEGLRASVSKHSSLHPNMHRPEALKAQLVRLLENTLYEEERAVGNIEPHERVVVEKRKRRNMQAVREIDKGEDPVKLRTNEVFTIQRDVVVVDAVPNGFEERIGGTDKDVEALIKTYEGTYTGTTDLAQNLRAAVAYITQTDLSRGRYPGVRPMSYKLTYKGQPMRVYELKPDEAPIPKNSRIFRRTRILFFLEDEKVALLAIKHKDELAQYERSLGVGSSRRA